MLNCKLACLTLLLFLPLSACEKPNHHSAEPESASLQFQKGKDYQLISRSAILPKAKPEDEVRVLEFFNYGCLACYQIEPALEKWLAQKPKYVKFERVPIVFQPQWRSLARVYYLSKMLGVERRLTPLLFKAVQVEAEDFTDPKQQAQFFISHGVNQQDYANMAGFLVGLESQLLRSDTLMRDYRIIGAPTLVINGKYKTDPSMVEGDVKRLFQVVDYLIDKVKRGDD